LLSLATPGVMRARAEEEDDPNEGTRRRKRAAGGGGGKKAGKHKKKGSRPVGGGAAADRALQEEAKGSGDLAVLYVACAALFAVLAAVLVWAYNTLL
jgi:hypothetical protein